MAVFTITIDDADVPRVTQGLSAQVGHPLDPSQEYAMRAVMNYIQGVVSAEQAKILVPPVTMS